MSGMVLYHLKQKPSFRYRTHLIIDEAASLGKMEMLYQMARTLKHGINFNLIYQSMAQLKKVFGEVGANIFRDQWANQIFLRPNCHETAKFISELIGNETVWTESLSTQIGYQ